MSSTVIGSVVIFRLKKKHICSVARTTAYLKFLGWVEASVFGALPGFYLHA